MSKEFESWWENTPNCHDPYYDNWDYRSAEYAWDACKQKVLDIIQNTKPVSINRSGKTALWEIVKKIKEL